MILYLVISISFQLFLIPCCICLLEDELTYADTYTPYQVQCPSFPILRSSFTPFFFSNTTNTTTAVQFSNQQNKPTLCPEELNYINQRHQKTSKSLKTLLARLQIPELNLTEIETTDINIAIAISGGGYRSMLTAAGALTAFEQQESPLNGLLQSSSYIAGVSGGSWLVSSLALYDYNRSIHEIAMKYWDLKSPILEGVPNFDPMESIESLNSFEEKAGTNGHDQQQANSLFSKLLSSGNSSSPAALAAEQIIPTEPEPESSTTTDWQRIVNYYKKIHFIIKTKKNSGFPLSITDYWGQAIASKIFPNWPFIETTTFSQLTTLPNFKNFNQPYPILNAISNHTIYEFTPHEFGSSTLGKYIKMEYLGSEINNDNQSICFKNLDNLGFITGTSSNLFNNIIIYIWKLLINSEVKTFEAIQNILLAFGFNLNKIIDQSDDDDGHSADYAIISPNPFNNKEKVLKLTDGGEDGENLPLQNFFNPARKVDLIIAIDSSNDFENWPNGTALRSTYLHNRTITKFPEIPTQQKFMELKLNKAPGFYNCGRGAEKAQDPTPEPEPGPLIVYYPNHEITYQSNTSTFKLTYTEQESSAMMQNGYNLVTQSNSTEFCQCIGCAILFTTFRKDHSPSTIIKNTFCESCYEKYCYN